MNVCKYIKQSTVHVLSLIGSAAMAEYSDVDVDNTISNDDTNNDCKWLYRP